MLLCYDVYVLTFVMDINMTTCIKGKVVVCCYAMYKRTELGAGAIVRAIYRAMKSRPFAIVAKQRRVEAP